MDPVQQFTPLNQTVLAVFAEPAAVQTAAGAVFLQGVFDDEYTPEGVTGNVQFRDRSHTLQILTSDLTANQVALRQTVTVRGKPYQILEIEDDIAGMSLLSLRRYS